LKFDVAIVAAVLAAQRVFGAEELGRTILLGEVGWTAASGRYAGLCRLRSRLSRLASSG
jgi:hypothetical protein